MSETAHLSYELQRSGTNFVLRHGRLEVEQSFDASTHESISLYEPLMSDIAPPSASSRPKSCRLSSDHFDNAVSRGLAFPDAQHDDVLFRLDVRFFHDFRPFCDLDLQPPR